MSSQWNTLAMGCMGRTPLPRNKQSRIRSRCSSSCSLSCEFQMPRLPFLGGIAYFFLNFPQIDRFRASVFPRFHLPAQSLDPHDSLHIYQGSGARACLLLQLPIEGMCNGNYIQDQFDNIHRATKITCPCLVIHGKRDKLIPFSHAESIYKNLASQRKSFKYPEHKSHNDFSFDDDLKQPLMEFIEEIDFLNLNMFVKPL